jgi:site-specific recombinase XerC
MAGVGIRRVQELLGHSTINMTARYTHLEPAQQLEAVELLVPASRVRRPQKRHARRSWAKATSRVE